MGSATCSLTRSSPESATSAAFDPPRLRLRLTYLPGVAFPPCSGCRFGLADVENAEAPDGANRRGSMVMATAGEQRRATTVIVERGDVLGALERLLNDACQGRGGALFVVGPAGLGKTTLIEHAISVARSRFVVGVGRGDQVEAVLPFGLIGQALNQLLNGKLLGGSMALDADGGEAGDISAQARLYGILRGVREAAVRPLLLALDDLHWSDPDSLTVIHLICRRLASLPVALIATARPWPVEAVTSARDLTAQGLAGIETLAPLSTGAARQLLCSRLSGQVPAEVVDQAIELCGGNPLLVEQVA